MAERGGGGAEKEQGVGCGAYILLPMVGSGVCTVHLSICACLFAHSLQDRHCSGSVTGTAAGPRRPVASIMIGTKPGGL